MRFDKFKRINERILSRNYYEDKREFKLSRDLKKLTLSKFSNLLNYSQTSH